MSQRLVEATRAYQQGRFDAVPSLLSEDRAAGRLPPAGVMLLGQCLAKLDRPAEAAACFADAADGPGADSKLLLTLALTLSRRAGEDWQAFMFSRRLLRLDPRHADALLVYRHYIHHWLDIEELRQSNADMRAGIEAGDPLLTGAEALLNHIAWCGDEALNQRVTHMQQGKPFREADRKARRGRPHRFAERPRIGYLSNDFADCHATIQLFQGVLEHHDESAVDVTLFCYTPDNLIAADGGFRQRHAERLVPIGHLDTAAARAAIIERSIDVLVDLKGHTGGAWVDLVNAGPAPIQVAYLGFPGSACGIDCDYIIGDPVVTPPGSAPFYHEKLCRLPESYQPNDNRRRVLPPPLSRADLALPEGRFIFNSSNTIRKITPETFDLWMMILRDSPDSLLWMMGERPEANANFLAGVASAGIDPGRVILFDKASYGHHLARVQAADLALDTFPCNGHTTTSELLWVGLPVLTMKGTNFSSRVSESLLRALAVPDLIAETPRDFVDWAVALSRDPDRLAALRRAIISARNRAPLFDTERLTRHLETAFMLMVDRAKSGLDPEHIDVPALPPRLEPFPLGLPASPAQAPAG